MPDETDPFSVLAEESRLRLLIDAVVDYAIYTIATNGRIVSWNAGARRLKGYEADEIIGRSYATFFTDEDRAAGVPERALAEAAATGRFELEGWRVRKDGTRFWALAVLDAIRDETGRVIGFAKVTRDISERREAEERLRETQAQLVAAQKMEAIGQLTGGIAHDFNNLLMIVLGNLEIAQRHAGRLGGDTANLDRSLANAVHGAQRAAALTTRLLAFSRRQALKPKPLDLNRFLRNIADFFQRAIGERIGIEVVGAGGLWLIEVDENQLETTLINLAVNARDAMPEGGKLTVEVSNTFLDAAYARKHPEVTAGQYVALAVTDTGSGMTPETVARVFEPFFTTKEAGHGTGLGLSQVYGFVKQSGGHVNVYSEIGRGTTVRLYFPRFLGEETPVEDVPDEPPGRAENDETILLVEDDEDVRSYLVAVLEELHYRVLAAPAAGQALTLLRQPETRIDLLLTDVVMPGLNGRELAQEARRLRPDLRVLYMTGYSRNAIIHDGRLDDGIDLVEKPVTQAQLAGRIRDMLDRRP